MSISKIVITGGPCAGKTTGMSWIGNSFTSRGYTVLFVPETATELINGGVAPWKCESNYEFQKSLLRLQMEKEKVFEYAAEHMNSEKILIVCDRGIMDGKCYMADEEFEHLISEIGGNVVELRDSYDAVFHLVTAAKGAEEYYTTANNTARTETVEEATILDDKLINAWTGHPHLRVIDNSTGFEEKMRKLVSEIDAVLGEPEPLEIERKFLIEYPDLEELEALPNCEKIDIVQTYLPADDNFDEIRIRQRGFGGHYMYYETRKKKISDIKRVEIERRLTKEEYLELFMNADPTKRSIRKKRYCLMENNMYFEIDIYPNWKDKAIIEVELSDENAPVNIPERFRVIREVTNDNEYKNSTLANIPE